MGITTMATMNQASTTFTEIPAEEIETLKQDAKAAIIEVTTPAGLQRIHRAKDVAAAREVIVKIPDMIRAQASDDESAGRGFVSIMELKPEDLKPGEDPFVRAPMTAENLVGVAAILFQTCEDAGLEPYLGIWWQFVGGKRRGLCIPLNDKGRQHAEQMKKSQ